MSNGLYGINGLWPGKLALSARPRSDWLEDDVCRWKRSGMNQVLSLLTQEEERDLGPSICEMTGPSA